MDRFRPMGSKSLDDHLVWHLMSILSTNLSVTFKDMLTEKKPCHKSKTTLFDP